MRWGKLIALLCLTSLLGGCVLVALADNRDCSDHIFDDLHNKAYRLARLEKGERVERGFAFQLRGDCTLAVPDSVEAIGVRAIELKNAHSARKATAVITTEKEDADGDAICCTAPFSTYGPMDFICPPELGGRSYRMAPLDIRDE